MTFEEWFTALYVKRGFVSSKEELREAWNAALGEPVAWLVVNDGGQDAFVTCDPSTAATGQRAIPLYTGMCSNVELRGAPK